MVQKLNISDKLASFIQEHMASYSSRQLILFFATHPRASFSEAAVTHAINQNGGKGTLQKALAELVDKNVITTYNKNEVRFYSLPDNKSLQNILTEFAGLDVSQQNLALKQSRIEPVEKEAGSLVSRFWGASCVQLPQLL
jgi:hypothetical protein